MSNYYIITLVFLQKNKEVSMLNKKFNKNLLNSLLSISLVSSGFFICASWTSFQDRQPEIRQPVQYVNTQPVQAEQWVQASTRQSENSNQWVQAPTRRTDSSENWVQAPERQSNQSESWKQAPIRQAERSEQWVQPAARQTVIVNEREPMIEYRERRVVDERPVVQTVTRTVPVAPITVTTVPVQPIRVYQTPEENRLYQFSQRDGYIWFHHDKNRYTDFLDPYYQSPVQVGGKTFRCCEAAYQAAKFSHQPQLAMQFINLKGEQAAKLGEHLKNQRRPDWNQIRKSVMLEVLRSKFQQAPELRNRLIATGNAYLVYHSKKNAYWGDGGNGKGKNHLGHLLMQVRGELGGAGDHSNISGSYYQFVKQAY